MNNLFVSPPVIVPSEYLSAADAAKTASVRLTSSPSFWDDEIRQTILRDHPYIPADRIVINFKRKDEAQGSAVGYASVTGAPQICLPIVIKRRELSPLDILIVRSNSDAGEITQGVGDMTEDKVVPLTEDTFGQALDSGSIGESIHENKVRGTGWTEDGSALRLPFRGRTVLASVMGANKEDRDKLASLIESDASVQAGFLNNGTDWVVNQWCLAADPRHSVETKLASTPVKKATIQLLAGLPKEVKTAEVNAAEVFVDSGRTKQAVAFNAVDLANPSRGLSRYLAYEDGTYCKAPEKIAVAADGDEAAVMQHVMEKRATGAVRPGMVVSFVFDDYFTVPAKIASVSVNHDQKTISLRMLDDMARSYDVLLSQSVKTAMLDKSTATWVLPLQSQLLDFDRADTVSPLPVEKVAEALSKSLPNALVCVGGQYSLSVEGSPFGGQQLSESKMAGLLDHWFANSGELLETAKTAGVARFSCDLGSRVQEVVKLANAATAYPETAAKAAKEIGMDFNLAVKLAASIGDPEGVDAILSAGFLNQDNLAEFTGKADQFEDTVSVLARLLLAIRMGFPGDESATVVAMKALHRVAERLKNAIQECGVQ